MDIINDDNCFVCGMKNPIGLKANFTVDKDKKTAQCLISIPDHFQGWKGIVHGGIIATLLDEAIAYSCAAVTDTGLTAEMSVRYIQVVPVNCLLEITGEIIEAGRRLIKAKSTIKLDDKILAEATGTVIIKGKL